jgi:hypothetical protein
MKKPLLLIFYNYQTPKRYYAAKPEVRHYGVVLYCKHAPKINEVKWQSLVSYASISPNLQHEYLQYVHTHVIIPMKTRS